MNTNTPPHAVPEFKPSAETELLCQDIGRDSNGRVFAHLLRQVDVAKQQNAHIIREQMVGAESRDRILIGLAEHTAAFKRHEEQDAVQFAAIRAAQAEMTDWRKTWFGKKGVVALVASGLLYVGYDAMLKPLIERYTNPPTAKQKP